ncbi:dTDP-4-dehydrorhamnose reductase [Methylophilus sp. QUAN]|uniref:dTDP-4-dehydrorhamnose reductase n=1 Tax=Methylophilus sp. QUAN TaxID=2781020 RepID=UPI0018905737|nr:dTDP-4-dehydrorhamnose reductase [Methylophilus sp. QUAN]MBF4990939.1 dTDP-4-dehydrorhamnose reductase [Methylophilus sp. QUAN]
MKKILLTGVSGQVGHALQQQLALELASEWQIVACDRQQLDLTQPEHIRRTVREIAPDLIIHPAAYTAVDKAESERELAYAINAIAPGVLAEEAATLNAGLIHFSTDYVYDGAKDALYTETDAVNPLSVYGASKLAGEEAIRRVGLPHLILRTSWVYGSYGKNFLKTIIRLSQEREYLRIVADQYGAPTADTAIAKAVTELVTRWHQGDVTQSGVYHLVNSGETSWFGFASEIVAQYRALESVRGWPPLAVNEVQPIVAAEYPTPAKRPQNSRLSTAKLEQTFGVTLPEWSIALNQVMAELAMIAAG